jgi:hypothetical protein
MDTLLSKLTDLAYEFFGVILPGLIFALFLTFFWISVGPMLPTLTCGHIQELTLRQIDWFESDLTATRRSELLVLLVVLCYFLGQFLNWISRGRSTTEDQAWWRRILRFRFARPRESYAVELGPLFYAAARTIAPSSETMKWPVFYPVAKSLIAQKLTYSLVPTYQHKYTLHRCLSAAGVAGFWACAISLAIGLVASAIGQGPNWWLLLPLTAVSLCVAYAFEKSYSYFWKLWGSTVVAESYGLLCVKGIVEKREHQE